MQLDIRLEYYWRVKFRGDNKIIMQGNGTGLPELVENVEWFEYVPVDPTRNAVRLAFNEGEVLHRFLKGYDSPRYGHTRYAYLAGSKGGEYVCIQPGFTIATTDRVVRFPGVIENINDPNQYCALDKFTDEF